ncbi:MAG: bifunctional phosphopantothenoylcysteine decarboxylase/phosphopantothenate--cysteine ligase CoaBC [Anaerolineae bacterium]|jgi:phosphopantothenoylcysteine decarboxylase/phosphopantothenate--cysteine ligase|nr:bifunctional phosphopantothenoylcysteine decarboxylase/phosphopantothenate--cysteine ligase CoaBC [Anaerolineae bacterium]
MSNPIQGKRIVLGVTGSIAAYKAADLASKLTQSGAEVDCILTESAAKFVSPLTFQSVTGRKAYVDADLWGSEGHVVHISLAHAADLLLIAPATASTMAKLAHGIGDNLLTVTALAADCPLVIAPAMDAGMFGHPATAENVALLNERGAYFIGPEPGRLASGLIGKGRFTEPKDILGHLRVILSQNGILDGVKVMVTAGPTREPLDPVRYLTNPSSGRQGYEIAQALLDAGAEVTLVSGPTQIDAPIGVELVSVNSSQDMLDAVMEEIEDQDVFISVAAVADFRPRVRAAEKIKKTGDSMQLELEATADILMNVSKWAQDNNPDLCLIGFAAETQDVIVNAESKLARKGLDLIIANDVSVERTIFGGEENLVTFIYQDGVVRSYDWMSKYDVGEEIVRYLAEN